jgi:hypothetical protein
VITQSRVRLFLVGDHTLGAFVDLSAGFSGRPPEPTFNVQFFKGNNVQGLVYFSNLRGLSLETRPVGVPLRLSSTKFVTIKRQGVTYSRIDFECNLLRVR